jgi:hypothetical protein
MNEQEGPTITDRVAELAKLHAEMMAAYAESEKYVTYFGGDGSHIKGFSAPGPGHEKYEESNKADWAYVAARQKFDDLTWEVVPSLLAERAKALELLREFKAECDGGANCKTLRWFDAQISRELYRELNEFLEGR